MGRSRRKSERERDVRIEQKPAERREHRGSFIPTSSVIHRRNPDLPQQRRQPGVLHRPPRTSNPLRRLRPHVPCRDKKTRRIPSSPDFILHHPPSDDAFFTQPLIDRALGVFRTPLVHPCNLHLQARPATLTCRSALASSRHFRKHSFDRILLNWRSNPPSSAVRDYRYRAVCFEKRCPSPLRPQATGFVCHGDVESSNDIDPSETIHHLVWPLARGPA